MTTDLQNKFVIVDGYYIPKASIDAILPSGDVLLLDGRTIENPQEKHHV